MKDIEIFESIKNIEKKKMEKGKWIPVIEFPEYMVSNQGHLKETKSGKILKEHKDGDGYLRVYMKLDGKFCFVRIDIVVLSSFDPKGLMKRISKKIDDEILEEIDNNNIIDCIMKKMKNDRPN